MEYCTLREFNTTCFDGKAYNRGLMCKHWSFGNFDFTLWERAARAYNRGHFLQDLEFFGTSTVLYTMDGKWMGMFRAERA